jgi:hypothetical protein
MSVARLETPAVIVQHLRLAVLSLRTAGKAALVSEEERSGLVGSTAMMLGGLEQAIDALADVIENGVDS